jgi:hypothetical protein
MYIETQINPRMRRRVIARCAVHSQDSGIGKRPRIELSGFLGIVVEAETDGVFREIRHG